MGHPSRGLGFAGVPEKKLQKLAAHTQTNLEALLCAKLLPLNGYDESHDKDRPD